MSRRAIPYKDALLWIVQNDDTNFLDDEEGPQSSVTLAFLADIYGRTDEEALADLRAERDRYRKVQKSVKAI